MFLGTYVYRFEFYLRLRYTASALILLCLTECRSKFLCACMDTVILRKVISKFHHYVTILRDSCVEHACTVCDFTTSSVYVN